MLVVRGADPADPSAVDRLDALLARRVAREPVAYILRRREFYGRDFSVSPAVLVPRPETELIVDAALARFRRDAAIEVLDVGTGSGCLAVTLALEFPMARLSATDVSAAALGVARENARRHGVLHRIAFQQLSLAADVEAIDLLVSNPPYAALADAATIPADVRDFEPHVAVFGGADGLDVIRALVGEAANVLARPGRSPASPDGGWLLLECGMGQAAGIERMLAASGLFESIETMRDLQGIPRTVTARRNATAP
jgi:release factor glutamine methyltransferase